MKRWFWVFLALVISTGVYFTIRYGLRPKPIPVIDPTEFADLEQVGVVVYKRLRHEIRAERIVLLGSSLEVADNPKVWSGFMKAAAADKEKIVFFPRSGVAEPPADSRAWETVTLDDAALQSGEFVGKVKERMKAGQLILVHGLTKEVSHLVSGSLSRQLETVVQHPVLSISALKFAIRPEDREALQAQCQVDEVRTGDYRLACAAQRVARKYQRKTFDPAKIWVVMERHGLKEYLVFIN